MSISFGQSLQVSDLSTHRFYILGRTRVSNVEQQFKVGILGKEEQVSKVRCAFALRVASHEVTRP